MLNSLFETIFGCAHHRTTFPITPTRNSQRAEGSRRATYIVCLDCGKEFDYNWKEMRMGAPSAQAVASLVPDQPTLVEALPIRAEQHVAH
jgi:hypothetical protein